MTAIIIYITCPEDKAQIIAKALVEKRMVACANIMPAHRAVYRWEGEVETGRECAIILKTRADMFEAVEEEVKALHPYECPCIVSWPIGKGHAAFLRWIDEEVDV